MENNGEKVQESKEKVVENPCPECGEELLINGHCKTCENCYWSSCDL